MLDERWIRALHVETMREEDLHAEREHPSSELHIELPPAVDLADPDLAASTHAAVDAVERAD